MDLWVQLGGRANKSVCTGVHGGVSGICFGWWIRVSNNPGNPGNLLEFIVLLEFLEFYWNFVELSN